MIVWAGRGILSAIVFVVLIFGSFLLFEDAFGVYHIEFSCVAAGLFSWYFGKKWNNNPRIVVDEQTGERYNLEKVHSLFWIPMQYWGIIFSVFGSIYAVQEGWLIGSVAICVVLVFVWLLFFKKDTEGEFPDEPESQETYEPSYRTAKREEEREDETDDNTRFMPK